MKIIAKGKGVLICEVSKCEIKKFMNKYGYRDNLPIDIGTEFNLGKGYDFLSDINEALGSFKPLLNGKEHAIKTIFEGVALLTRLSENTHETEQPEGQAT